MQRNDDVDRHAQTTTGAHYHPPPPPPSPSVFTKPNPKFLSLVLKALIMSLLTSLFFLFLGVAAIVFVHLCLAGHHLHRRRRSHPQPHDSPKCGISRKDLMGLPRFRYVSGTKSPVSVAECVVCLENFREGDYCRSLPECRHVFHSNCIDSWLVKVPACPVCRRRVSLDVGAGSSAVGTDEFKQLLAVRA